MRSAAVEHEHDSRQKNFPKSITMSIVIRMANSEKYSAGGVQHFIWHLSRESTGSTSNHSPPTIAMLTNMFVSDSIKASLWLSV